MLKPRVFILLFPLLLGVSYFYNSWTQPLLADEPTRAIVSLEMLLRGDAFPTINNEAYLNKPPLYNWILVPFLMVFGESEWVVRLPAILSLLALGYLIFYFYQKITGDKEVSFFTAMAFLTSGNILFYSSLLGHIDATFSIVIFAHFMLCYLLGSSGKWNLLFRWSYVLCFIGFMLKGLPSIVFVGVSLLVTALFFKQFKRLFSASHWLNMLWFVVPIVIYFAAFSQFYPLTDYVQNLWVESSKRTVIEKSFLESIGHLFTFPFQFILETAPWSFLIALFFHKKCRQFVAENEFLRFSVYLFFANIAVYWLAPDTRARYVMMLYPIYFSLLFFAFKALKPSAKRVVWYISPLLASLLLLGLGVFYFVDTPLVMSYLWEWVVILVLMGIGLMFALSSYRTTFYPLLFLLIVIRFGFDSIVIPERAKTGETTQDKKEALEIAKIVGTEPLAMFNSNLHHSSTYYLTRQRQAVLPIATTKDSCDKNTYYLTPTDLIKDSASTPVHYTFVRRYMNKPFSLVKFKNGFPKKKE